MPSVVARSSIDDEEPPSSFLLFAEDIGNNTPVDGENDSPARSSSKIDRSSRVIDDNGATGMIGNG